MLGRTSRGHYSQSSDARAGGESACRSYAACPDEGSGRLDRQRDDAASQIVNELRLLLDCSFSPPMPGAFRPSSGFRFPFRVWPLVARASRPIALDELRLNPDRVSVAVILRARVERIIELQFRSADIVVSDELDRLPNDGSYGTLVFVRQSVQQARRNGNENDPFTSAWPNDFCHRERFYLPLGCRGLLLNSDSTHRKPAS